MYYTKWLFVEYLSDFPQSLLAAQEQSQGERKRKEPAQADLPPEGARWQKTPRLMTPIGAREVHDRMEEVLTPSPVVPSQTDPLMQIGNIP